MFMLPPLNRSAPQEASCLIALMPSFFAMSGEQVPEPTAQTNLLHELILIMCCVQVCSRGFGHGGSVEVPLRTNPSSPPRRAPGVFGAPMMAPILVLVLGDSPQVFGGLGEPWGKRERPASAGRHLGG